MMERMGFPLKWRKWIVEYVSTARIYVLLNGSPTGEFGVGKGLRKLFLWGGDENHRKIAWVAWQEVGRGKGTGGLGILDLRAFNLALLGKWR
uniref:Uncharacterized protein n=1 Tax=Cajanus cajan TaxID=3821 RepID=A0A151RYS1_CAJCA|nr:hypothetical protein KK1_030642 [Cajanus cajan]